MTSLNNFELPNFQKQLSNAIANVFNPDAQLKTLISDFVSLSNPTAEDFNSLAASVGSHLENASSKTKAAFAPIVTLFMVEQVHMRLQDHEFKANSFSNNVQVEQGSFASSGNAIMQCVGKPGAFTLNLITNTPTNLDEFFSARNACKSFSATKGDHWLTFTGEVDGCKGPYKSADAFYACEMAI